MQWERTQHQLWLQGGKRWIKKRMLLEQGNLTREESGSGRIAQIGEEVHHVCLICRTGTVGNWESVKRRKLSWKDIWQRDTSQNCFLLSATYDIRSSPMNLNQWKEKIHNVCYSQIQTPYQRKLNLEAQSGQSLRTKQESTHQCPASQNNLTQCYQRCLSRMGSWDGLSSYQRPGLDKWRQPETWSGGLVELREPWERMKPVGVGFNQGFLAASTSRLLREMGIWASLWLTTKAPKQYVHQREVYSNWPAGDQANT